MGFHGSAGREDSSASISTNTSSPRASTMKWTALYNFIPISWAFGDERDLGDSENSCHRRYRVLAELSSVLRDTSCNHIDETNIQEFNVFDNYLAII